MSGSRGGYGVRPPTPGKSQVIWVSIEITHWTPPWKKLPSPLEKVTRSETFKNNSFL